MNQKQTAATVKECLTTGDRERFEHWASDDGEYPKAIERVGNCYRLAQTQAYWMAWHKCSTESPAIAVIDTQAAELERLRQSWISVAERLPEPGVTVFVYSPPQPDDWPDSVRIGFDAVDPEDGESWINHNAHYEHYCCVAKGDTPMTGPSEKAPYTHWMPAPAVPTALSGEQK